MKKKNILILGGSGYIGANIVSSLQDYNFINISKNRINQEASNNIIVDITKGLDFLRFSKDIDCIINCTDIADCGDDKNYRCYANSMQKLTYLMDKIKVKKIIHFSNYAQPRESNNSYIQNKLLAERVIEHSGAQFIIFKTTQVFGENSMLDGILKRLSKSTVVSKAIATKKLSPVFIGDVVKNVKYAIENDDCWNSSYVVCGPEEIELGEAINRYSLKKIKTIKVPNLLSKIYMSAIFDKKIINFYESYIDVEPMKINCEYPSLLKAQKFY
ncbi:MAG: hypothetical protein QG567_123 [Campylobacterota bacterium]|nr:hypothetical protein [Campylobacterota bacterium]